MTFYSLFLLLPLFTSGLAPSNAFYTYGGKLTQTITDTGGFLLGDNNGTDGFFYTTNTFTFECSISYENDGSYSYYLNNFKFTISSNLYFAYDNTEASYLGSLTYSYTPNWEYTQNTSFIQLENLEYYVLLDGYNEEFVLGFSVDGVTQASTYLAQGFGTSDEAYFGLNVDASSLDNQIQNFLMSGLDYAEVEGLVQTAHDEGFQEGVQYASNNGEAAVVFSGILSVALLPVNFFLQILNFEVFGINIGGFVTGMLTLAIIFIIWRVILGGKASTK